MRLIIAIICIVFGSFTEISRAEIPVNKDKIRYIKPFTDANNQTNFFIDVLEHVCQITKNEFGECELIAVDLPMTQVRQIRSLNNNVIDVLWTVTSPEREAEATAIKFPLMQGLIGYRVAVYNANVDYAFLPNQPIEKIKKLSLLQGHDWPDVNVLRFNDFKVDTVSWDKHAFYELGRGVYDYTLRGVLELSAEAKFYQEYNLQVDPNNLFVYPSFIYFFVGKNNTVLADRINAGLAKLKKSGDYIKLLKSHPLHSELIGQLELSKRRLHLLSNGKQIADEMSVKQFVKRLETKESPYSFSAR